MLRSVSVAVCMLILLRVFVVLQSSVVGVSCLGVSHPLFKSRIFDVVIVDEASQVTEPVSGPAAAPDCSVDLF